MFEPGPNDALSQNFMKLGLLVAEKNVNRQTNRQDSCFISIDYPFSGSEEEKLFFLLFKDGIQIESLFFHYWQRYKQKSDFIRDHQIGPMECLYEKYERKNLVTTCLGLLTRPNLRWPLFYRKITEITIKYELIYLELQFWCLNVGLEGQGLT